MNTHEFALYVSQLDSSSALIKLTDQEIVHRIARVLRLQVDDILIMFDQTQHIRARIAALGKKEIALEVVSKRANQVHKPHLSFLLPILKRDAFEAALYLLVEAGVNDIYPIVTAKAHRKWGGPRERERLERIIISAAEQSKNFSFPKLHDPIPFEQALAHQSEKKIFFDAEGSSFTQVNQLLKDATSFVLLIGPEGDLTAQEKELVEQHGFIKSKLTPTILRAQDAAGLSACMIRSLQN